MMDRAGEAEALIQRLAAEPPREPRTCDLMAELLAERTDLIGALAWAGAGVELCLGRSPGPVATAGDADTEEPEMGPAGERAAAAGAAALPPAGRAELRLLLTLRFRIRNDLGLPEDPYDRLLDELTAHATQPKYQYRHRWRQGDVVIWDNRCTMHKANADYPDGEERVMHRVVVAGTAPF